MLISTISINYDRIGMPSSKRGPCSLKNFIYMIGVFMFLQLRERTCCFNVKKHTKVRTGVRLHCESLFDAFDKLKGGGGDKNSLSTSQHVNQLQKN